MMDRRGHQQESSEGDKQQGDEVVGSLEGVDLLPAGLERDDQQEREHHLDAGSGDAQFIEQLGGVAVELLGRDSSRARSACCPPSVIG